MRMDTSSICSNPSSSSNGPKKRGFSGLSLRRLFYASLQHRRFAALRKRSSPPEPTEIDVSNADGASFSSHTLPFEISHVVAAKDSYILASNGRDSHNPGSQVVDDICLPNQIQHFAGSSRSSVECPLCLSEFPMDCFPPISTCPHRSCYECLRVYLRIEITESRVNISCPECTEPLHPNDIHMILDCDTLKGKYEEFMLRRVLVAEPDARWCPAPDCCFAVIATGCASCPKLKCERPGCNTYFCYHCKQDWHPNQTCDAARAQRSPNVRSSSVSFSQESGVQRDDIKSCPRCQVLIVKMDDGSCNHMTCAFCGAEFCWLCMKEISDLHYLSPSGCTFWGKKPWSRKKKILWQLGTLVGAPVGIGLVAGIAVPAMIIGIPVWVGRKLHARFEHASKHRRNLAITGGVTASILVSPILAGLAIGIGVPILLAYVYGVVPISLCRSGGCGVTTSASGVRIEFDDENDLTLGAAGHGTSADAQSVDTSSHRVANPSIGEVSFGMSASLSMGSGSHLERVGLIRDSDRESASNTAIAGASLTGSIISSMTNATTGHRLEVQADVASNKRFSISSETASATVSLSERSATLSVADDASTKGLAGSVLNYRDNTSVNYTPVEIHTMEGSFSIPVSIPLAQDETEVHTREECTANSSASFREQKHVSSDFISGTEEISKGNKQVNLNIRDENCSYPNTGNDNSSEKVRFDDNVSFIDDPCAEDAQACYPLHDHDGPSGYNRPYLSTSTSWHEGVHFRSGGIASSSFSAHTIQAIAEINLAAVGICHSNGAGDRPSKSTLMKRSSKVDAGSAAIAEETEGVAAEHEGSRNGAGKESEQKRLPADISQLSLPASSDADTYQAVAWATHQSLPCILDTEQTFKPIVMEIKQV